MNSGNNEKVRLAQSSLGQGRPYIDRYRGYVQEDMQRPAEAMTLLDLDREIGEFDGLADKLIPGKSIEPALIGKWQNDLGRIQASLEMLALQVQKKRRLRDEYDGLGEPARSKFATENQVPRPESIEQDEALVRKARKVISLNIAALQRYTTENAQARDAERIAEIARLRAKVDEVFKNTQGN